MRAAIEREGSGIRRWLQLIVLLCPALTVAVKGGANGSLMIAAALSLLVLLRRGGPAEGRAVGRSNELVRTYAMAMAAPVFALLVVQTLHGGPWAVGAVSSSARFLLAVPIVLVMWRFGGSLVPWADASFALGAVAAGAVMLLSPREWSVGLGRWGSAFLDPINFGGLSLLLGVLSVLSLDWYRRDPWAVRVLKIAGFVSGFCASVPTGARGPWMALLVVIALLALTTLRRHSTARRIVIWSLVTSALLFTFATIDSFRGRFDLMATDLGSFFLGGERDTSPGIRLQIWRAALLAFAEQPLLGLGAGGFANAVDRYVGLGLLSPLAAEAARAEMHNGYLAFAANFGIAGLLAIVAVFVVPAAAFARRLGADAVRGRAALMGLVVIVMYASSAITVEVFALKMMAAFYAACTAFLAAIAFSDAGDDARPAPGNRAGPITEPG
jgi:O-antigen ligase